MEISTLLSQTDVTKLKSLVESVNKGLAGGKGIQNVLDKNDFLKIMLTQLTHQDPTQPLEDREFISQMATFSTLEQITNMNDDIEQIFSMMRRGQALGLLGKTVEITPTAEGAPAITGVVQEVSGSEFPQIRVGGTFYDFADVQRIRN
jgi:flagellar basal-body rod modification protein FlgD